MLVATDVATRVQLDAARPHSVLGARFWSRLGEFLAPSGCYTGRPRRRRTDVLERCAQRARATTNVRQSDLDQLSLLGPEYLPTTPVRRQYLEIKARHPDTILFFRLGDF